MSAQDFVFFLFTLLAVGAAVMVVIVNNPVHSALWLILNMVSIAALYYTLQAPFLMAVQLIVYAGAIVVLFLFVIMLLISKGQAGGTPGPLRWLTPATFIGALLLGVLLLMVALARPQGNPAAAGAATVGSPYEVGRVLYRDYLLPFEATSILLLTALVGAMYLGRHSDKAEEEDEAEMEPVVRTDDVPTGPAPEETLETTRVRIPEDANA